jgi:DNA-binding transcriptional ArsR family regulator
MLQEDDRLHRYLEVESCCDEDVQARIEQLEAIRDSASKQNSMEDLRALSALANDTRYEITRILSEADGELCVCEFSPLLEVTDSAISHALSKLTDSGLLTRRKEGKWRYYDTTERAERLLSVLDAINTP